MERFQKRDYKIKSELEKEKAIECAVKRGRKGNFIVCGVKI